MFCQTRSLNIANKNFNLIIFLSFITIISLLILFIVKMEDDNFYIHLSSNVNPVSPLQVGNSIGNFVTHLSRKLNLSDEWEVGLTDISYTKTWYNIMRDEFITLKFSDEKYRNKDYTFFVLKAGNYDSPDSICRKINEVLEYNLNFFTTELNIESFPRLEYHKESNKIKMIFGTQENENFYYIHFSEFLASMLGFLDSQGRQYPIFPPEPNHPWYSVRTLHLSQNHPDLIALSLTKGTEKGDLPIFVTNKEIPTEDSSVTSPIVNTIFNSETPIYTSEKPKETQVKPLETNQNISPVSNSEITTEPPVKPLVTDPVKTSVSTESSTKSKAITEQKRRENSTKHPKLPGGVEYDDARMNRQRPRDYDRAKRSNSSEEINKLVKREVRQPILSSFNEVTLNAEIHSLYVYCNIIKPTLIGNIEAPLIRRVEIPSDKQFGDTVNIIYIAPQYYSLVSEEISYIEIDIKDDTNETIQFTSGRTALTLHFRKKPKNVFESVYSLLR